LVWIRLRITGKFPNDFDKRAEILWAIGGTIGEKNATTVGNVIGLHALSPPVIGEAKNSIFTGRESSSVGNA
jgi:hypothetical protein